MPVLGRCANARPDGHASNRKRCVQVNEWLVGGHDWFFILKK